jgi:hypothetical protein
VTLGMIGGELESHKDRITAMCAHEGTVPRGVTVQVIGLMESWHTDGTLKWTSQASIHIQPVGDDLFTNCFAREAMQEKEPHPFIAQSFKGTVTLLLSPPDTILAGKISGWLREQREDPGCWPRAGAIPHTLAIDVSSDDVYMTVTARTTPSNADVETCVTDSVNEVLMDAGIRAGEWKPTLRVKQRIEPRVSSARLRAELPDLAREAAASCIPSDVAQEIDDAIVAETKPRRIGKMRVTATAKRDAAAFVAVARSGDKTRDACTKRALEAKLRERFELRFEDETIFRIDSNATASASFEIETEGQLETRHDAERSRRRSLK